jgi:hypothetical protein
MTPESKPSGTEVVEGVTELVAGTGLAFFSFAAAIPGLLPALLLAALLLIPLLVVVAPIAVLVGAVMARRRLIAATRARRLSPRARKPPTRGFRHAAEPTR